MFKLKSMEEPKKESAKRLKDHDIFVRGLFSYKEFVLKILLYIVPKELKPFINFDSLKILSDIHISDKLLLSQSDTIYEAALNEETLAESVRNDKNLPHFRFCFLGEFKSSKPAEPIDFQVDDYIRSIQRNDLQNGRPPSIVLPIILYHGPSKWEYKRLYDTFARYLPETLLRYVNAPNYLIIDLQAMSDQLIKDATDLGELRAAFLALKHAQEKQFFIDNFSEMLKFVEDTPTTLLLEAYVKMLLEYFQRRSGLGNEKFNEIFEQSKSKFNMAATASKTIFDFWEKKYFKQGRKEGLKEGREEIKETNRKAVLALIRLGNLTDTQIAESLELPIAFVETIRKEMTQS
jgi:Putative transposase, YhgA-like